MLQTILKDIFGTRETPEAPQDPEIPEPDPVTLQNDTGQDETVQDAIESILTEGLFTRPFPKLVKEVAEIAETNGLDAFTVCDKVKRSFHAIAVKSMEDGVVTVEEEQKMDALLQFYGIESKTLFNATQQLIAKGLLIRDLLSGNVNPRFTVEKNPFRFSPNEVTVWGWVNMLVETVKTKSLFLGRSQGLSFRLMKGVYWRTGGHAGEKVELDVREPLGLATVAVTSKHIYCQAGHKARKIKLADVVSVSPLPDSVLVTLQKGNPFLFYDDDPWFLANIIQNADNWDVPLDQRKKREEVERQEQDLSLLIEFFPLAVEFAKDIGDASIALIMNKFDLRFEHAVMLVEKMERGGIIALPDEETGKRMVIQNPSPTEET